MRTIRNFFAVVLMGLAFSAFQVDADAQSRSREGRSGQPSRSASRSTSVNRSSKPASSSKSSVSAQSRPSSDKKTPSRVSGQSSQSRPVSPNGPAPSVSKPSGGAAKPQMKVSRPSSSSKPSAPVKDVKPSNTVQKPASRPQVNRQPERSSQHLNQRPKPGQGYKPEPQRPPVQIRPDHRNDRPRVHPVHRDFIPHSKPAVFWTAHHHYFGHRVRVLPARAVLHRHFGIDYYCYNDIWYRPYRGHYVICRPPFGTVLAAAIIKDITWTAVRFSYYNTVAGVYRQINENNAYIAQQNEIIAQNNATIAAQNNAIAMNQAQASVAYGLADRLGLVQSYAAAGSEYFYQDGVFYTMADDGKYTVIVPPAGAMVEALPEDYEMITLDGEEYYKVDDTVYKVSISDAKPYFEVLGQLYN